VVFSASSSQVPVESMVAELLFVVSPGM